MTNAAISIQKTSGIAVSALLAATISFWMYHQSRRNAKAASKSAKEIVQKVKVSQQKQTTEQEKVVDKVMKAGGYSNQLGSSEDDKSISSEYQKARPHVSTARSTPKKIMAKKVVTHKTTTAVPASVKVAGVVQAKSTTARLPLSPLTSNPTATTSKASKKSPTQPKKSSKKRIRVRDSLLPAQIRQNVQAARATKNNATTLSSPLLAIQETIRPPPPPPTTSNKRTALLLNTKGQKQTRRQIRVRDSLLPASVRQNRDRQLGRLVGPSSEKPNNDGSHLVSSSVSAAAAAPQRQVMDRTPPSNSAISTSGGNGFIVRRVKPNKLSPTRRNMYEKGGGAVAQQQQPLPTVIDC